MQAKELAPTGPGMDLCCIDGCTKVHSNHVYNEAVGRTRELPNSQRYLHLCVSTIESEPRRAHHIFVFFCMQYVSSALHSGPWAVLCKGLYK
jgi:hypothetical protein